MSTRSRAGLSPAERLARSKGRALAHLRKSLPALRQVVWDAMPPLTLHAERQDDGMAAEAVAVFWLLRETMERLTEIDRTNASEKLKAWLHLSP